MNSCYNPCQRINPPCIPNCPPRPPRPPYNPPMFRSIFLEAVGAAQVVAAGANVVFDTSADTIDIAGTGIEISADGTTFTIRKPGLYQVEWSINFQATTAPVEVGLMENGNPTSALSNNTLSGNLSSGALINVQNNAVPYTISLHNFGSELTLNNYDDNTAASIRILRFADGASN